MSRPAISVIMPFYNASNFLSEAVNSILGQSMKNFELIIINDASTDSSDNIIKNLKDKRIRYVHNKNRKGIVFNLNRGIELAQADLLARMDGDDVAHPQRFEKQFKFMQSHPKISLVGSYAEMIDENGKSLGKIIKPTAHEDIQRVCFFYGPFIHPSVMYRKKAVVEAGRYREQYELTEDVDLFLRMIYEDNLTANIPELLLRYRQHGNSTSRHSKEIGLKSFRLKREIVKKYRLSLSLKELASIYIHFFLDMTLSGERKRKLQLQLKNLVRT
jgi:glycosyltransferase involved in cell wall biosynthesis